MKNIHRIKTLDELLNYLHSLHPKYIDFKLDRIKRLMKKLGNPEKKLPTTVHIAGTNGKGSTLAFIKSIAVEHGLSVNSYSSPHLVNFNERINLHGRMISSKFLFEILKQVAIKNNDELITFFEITTAAAFVAFSSVKSDLCIIETGLGGRLDATNILEKKDLIVITNIGYDHKEFLGNTLKNIIFEKCGILIKDTPVVIAEQNSNYISQMIKKYALKKNNQVLKLSHIPKNWKLGLEGTHQYQNAENALTVVKHLYKKIDTLTIQNGLNNTKWPGRLERIKNGKLIHGRKCITLIDGAHNLNGAKIIKSYLNNYNKKKFEIIIGMMNNKDVCGFIDTLKHKISNLYLVPIANQRNSYDPENLKQILTNNKFKIRAFNCLEDAIQKVPKDKPLLITGSLYLMGEIISKN